MTNVAVRDANAADFDRIVALNAMFVAETSAMTSRGCSSCTRSPSITASR